MISTYISPLLLKGGIKGGLSLLGKLESRLRTGDILIPKFREKDLPIVMRSQYDNADL